MFLTVLTINSRTCDARRNAPVTSPFYDGLRFNKKTLEGAFGFSNDARGIVGPPDYDEAKFIFNQKNKTVVIQIK